MIFVTIGTQLPFDRLIKIIDELAPQLNEEVVAQVYQCGFTPQNIKTVDFLAPDEFNTLFDKARLIISHAGMGTILSALQKDKPIIVFPDPKLHSIISIHVGISIKQKTAIDKSVSDSWSLLFI